MLASWRLSEVNAVGAAISMSVLVKLGSSFSVWYNETWCTKIFVNFYIKCKLQISMRSRRWGEESINYTYERDEQVILVVLLQGPIGLRRGAVNVATVGRGAWSRGNIFPLHLSTRGSMLEIGNCPCTSCHYTESQSMLSIFLHTYVINVNLLLKGVQQNCYYTSIPFDILDDWSLHMGMKQWYHSFQQKAT